MHLRLGTASLDPSRYERGGASGAPGARFPPIGGGTAHDLQRARGQSVRHDPRLHAQSKQIALIAHDHCKSDLLDWARYNRATLAGHDPRTTGTTGQLLARELASPSTAI